MSDIFYVDMPLTFSKTSASIFRQNEISRDRATSLVFVRRVCERRRGFV